MITIPIIYTVICYTNSIVNHRGFSAQIVAYQTLGAMVDMPLIIISHEKYT